MVTGGAGFIGSNFIHLLLEKEDGINIVNLDALTYAGNIQNLDALADLDRYKFVHGDICDKSLVHLHPYNRRGINPTLFSTVLLLVRKSPEENSGDLLGGTHILCHTQYYSAEAGEVHIPSAPGALFTRHGRMEHGLMARP